MTTFPPQPKTTGEAQEGRETFAVLEADQAEAAQDRWPRTLVGKAFRHRAKQ